jgi:hypothetical protein
MNYIKIIIAVVSICNLFSLLFSFATGNSFLDNFIVQFFSSILVFFVFFLVSLFFTSTTNSKIYFLFFAVFNLIFFLWWSYFYYTEYYKPEQDEKKIQALAVITQADAVNLILNLPEVQTKVAKLPKPVLFNEFIVQGAKIPLDGDHPIIEPVGESGQYTKGGKMRPFYSFVFHKSFIFHKSSRSDYVDLDLYNGGEGSENVIYDIDAVDGSFITR